MPVVVQGVWRACRAHKREMAVKAEAESKPNYSTDFWIWADAQRRTWSLGPSWKPSSGSSTAFTKFEAMDWGVRRDCLMSAAHFLISRGLWAFGPGGMPTKQQLEHLLMREAGWRSAVGGGSEGFSKFEYMSWAADVQKLLTGDQPRWGMGGSRQLHGSTWERQPQKEAGQTKSAVLTRSRTSHFQRDKSTPLTRAATFHSRSEFSEPRQPPKREPPQNQLAAPDATEPSFRLGAKPAT
mmetsp:Transcript_23892/g.66286  ORF Transcript_23892/g.66286 Transcript_23892/m.66286 type:complete len:239 (+) Transcript_23892:555-1271(+)